MGRSPGDQPTKERTRDGCAIPSHPERCGFPRVLLDGMAIPGAHQRRRVFAGRNGPTGTVGGAGARRTGAPVSATAQMSPLR